MEEGQAQSWKLELGKRSNMRPKHTLGNRPLEFLFCCWKVKSELLLIKKVGEARKLPWKWTNAFLFITLPEALEILGSLQRLTFFGIPALAPAPGISRQSISELAWVIGIILGRSWETRILEGFQRHDCHRCGCTINNSSIQHLEAVHTLPNEVSVRNKTKQTKTTWI